MSAFRASVAARHGIACADYDALHRWSVSERAAFWSDLWDYAAVIAATRGARVLEDGYAMPGARWFPDARLNFAANLLRYTGSEDAIVFLGEGGVERRLSRDGLRAEVAACAAALCASGVRPGDRVGAFLPNMPETVVAMLATASLGALWSSCSPDFGVKGVLDRFGQIAPKVLIATDGYRYGGKAIDTRARVAEIVAACPSIERVVIAARDGGRADLGIVPRSVAWADFVGGHRSATLTFAALPFDHPLYILFSSGTTGLPKCIVHGAGGTLLQHLKEHRLHTDVKPGDRLFYFTTCGWMMWNWLISGLASGACLMLYDGSPFHPGPEALFDFAQRERITIFGTSARYIDAIAKAALAPARTHDLGALKTILSTGSPLAPASFDYVYAQVKRDVCLSSISGGTDIVSCFALGNPSAPVWRGEIQAPGLGMAVEVFDEAGRPVVGEKGELVCTRPFPSMPLGFWNDDDGARYRAAYFERFPGVWHHGDYVERTRHGGFVIYGRSDAVLNPGGVRIGTAEIYRQVEGLDEVLESLAIGQAWQGDVRVVLFVRLREGHMLDEDLRTRIRERVREGASPRHVPARIVQVADIPRTVSGKIVEIAVRDIVHGREVRNRDALANPEALALFADLPELRT